MAKNWMKMTVAACLVSLGVSGCAEGMNGGGGGGLSKADIGTLLGGAGGAVAGAQFGKGRGQLVGVAAGTLLGAALGRSVGSSLDKADLSYYNQASQSALETGRTGSAVGWRNPDSGTYGSITPTRTYETGGTYCREYTQTINVGGRLEEGHGRACRQGDGTWQIVQ